MPCESTTPRLTPTTTHEHDDPDAPLGTTVGVFGRTGTRHDALLRYDGRAAQLEESTERSPSDSAATAAAALPHPSQPRARVI